MASITVKPIANQSEWEQFLQARADACFLQSWGWGDFQAALGKTVFRMGFYDGDQLLGLMLSIVEPARRGRHLVVPAGPIIDWASKALAKAVVMELRRQAKTQHCWFVRVRPQLESSDASKKLFGSLGFRPAPFHLHAELTHVLPLDKPVDELLAGMRKKTRYEVRKAQTEKIQISTSTNPDDIQAFYELQLETAKRQSFVPFSLKFLQEQFRVFAANDQAVLYTATLGKTVLAQAFIIFYGPEAVYHYGASSPAGRDHPGAYLIQWQAIQDAQARGHRRYNFWGVAPADQPQHSFAGISTFKRGFGGEDYEYLHAHDLVINKVGYRLSYLIETVRRHKRHV